MPSVRSVSLGFWVGAGSRAESEAEAGLSHLLEHLLFKGSAKYGSLEIDQIFDAMGAELNAGTGKETTSVFARVIDDHLDDAFDVMADMVFRTIRRRRFLTCSARRRSVTIRSAGRSSAPPRSSPVRRRPTSPASMPSATPRVTW